MKTILLFFVFMVAMLTGRAQIYSDCTPTPQLKKLYLPDAADIALERIYGFRVPDTALIEIQARYIDTVLSALAAVHNLGAQLEADSIFNNFCVHRMTQYLFIPQTIVVRVDTSYAWAKQWFLGKKQSGDPVLDTFLGRYNVELTEYRFTPGLSDIHNHKAILTARRPINMKVFADSLLHFKGVEYYNYLPRIGSGNYIRYNTDSQFHLTFSAGWGDCPSGCTSRKTWKYSIDLKGCFVSLDTIYLSGDNEPRRLANCNMWPASVKPAIRNMPLTVIPNPATTAIRIEGLPPGAMYRIIDLSGRTILNGIYSGKEIDLSRIGPGLYTLHASTPDGKLAVVKLVRR